MQLSSCSAITWRTAADGRLWTRAYIYIYRFLQCIDAHVEDTDCHPKIKWSHARSIWASADVIDSGRTKTGGDLETSDVGGHAQAL